MSGPRNDDEMKALISRAVDDEQKQLAAPLGKIFDEPVPDPMSEAFAVTEADREGHAVNAQPWTKTGAWKHREFAEEVQLRNAALPHLAMDLFRAEAEDLHAALGLILSKPQSAPFRLSRWQRVKQWWLRAVWKRHHHAELALAREAFVDEYTRKVWGNQ